MDVKKITKRILLAALIGTFNSFLFCPTCFWNPTEPNLNVLIYYFLSFFITYEILSFGVKVISKKYNWITEPRKIIIANLILLLFIYLPINFVALELNFRPHPDRFDNLHIYSLNRHNFLTALVVLLYLNSFNFLSSWKKSNKNEQELLKHQAKHELQALKNQIDPHFLFNNLNTLSHLVEEKSPLAEKYIYQLSTIYRYLLEQKNRDLVFISKELINLRALIYILEVKHGNNLNFVIDETEFEEYKIATFTLQMLVENAVKHNVIDRTNILTIAIHCQNKYLVIENNITNRPNIAYSSGIGLTNIVERYKLLTDKEVFIKEDENNFEVKIPLLS